MKKFILQTVAICIVVSMAVYAKAPDVFTVSIGDYKKTYPVVAPQGNKAVKIVYIPDFNDNYQLAYEAAQNLVYKLKESGLLKNIQALVVPGDKANMLATVLFRKLREEKQFDPENQIELCILRSSEKGKIAFSQKYNSITGGNKELRMRPDQADRLKGKTVLIFDDVMSTGGTFEATKALVEKVGCKVAAYACVATEGEERNRFSGKPLLYLVHLPVFKG